VELQDPNVSELEHPSLRQRVHANSFGPASEEPYRRRVSDWIRLGVGVALLAVLTVHYGEASRPERELSKAIRSFPNALESPVRLLYGLGALWAIGLVVAAVGARRRRLVRDLLLGAGITWVLSRVVAALAGEAVFSHSLDVFTQVEPTSTVFPALRVALLVGVIAVASPYLTRPIRHVGQVLVLLMFVAAMYIGASFDEVAAGIVLGWMVAAGIHLVFGSPGGRPTAAQVQAALAELGVPVHDVVLAADQPCNATRMVAYDDRGALRARVLGRDEADAQFLAKFWRWLLCRKAFVSFFPLIIVVAAFMPSGLRASIFSTVEHRLGLTGDALTLAKKAFASSKDLRDATGFVGLVLTIFYASSFTTALQRVYICGRGGELRGRGWGLTSVGWCGWCSSSRTRRCSAGYVSC
jgi:hypothetical protein